MYALHVSGAVNMQGSVWKFFYAPYINFHSFIICSNSWESYTEVNLCKAVADLSYCNSRQPGAALDSGDSVFVLPTPSGCSSKTDGCQHSHLCLISLVDHRTPRADLYP